MSDTSILPGAAAPAGGTAVPAPPGFDDEGGGDDRRRLFIIGGAILTVLIVVVAYLLLSGGSSSSDSGTPTTGLIPHGTPAASASTPAAAGGSSSGAKHHAGTVLPRKVKPKLRDPFKPLITVAVPGAGTVVGSTSVSPAPSSAPGTVPTSPAEGGAPSKSLGAPRAIRLLRVHGAKSALFEVSYAHHQVFRYDVVAPSATSQQGTVFAQDFALLGIQGSEVTIQVGDDTPFDLRVGASHTV